jgi:hypothetical protein
VFEFAKRLITLEEELTPIGPKNIMWCMKAPSMIVSLLLDLQGKGYWLTDYLIKQMFRTIKTIPVPLDKRSIEKLYWMICGPFGFVDSKAISSLQIEIELSGYKIWPIRLATKRVLLLSQYQDYENSLKKSEVAISLFSHSASFEEEWGISLWRSPAMSSVFRTMTNQWVDLLERSPLVESNNELIQVALSGGSEYESHLSYLNMLLEKQRSYSPSVSLSSRKPKVPSLRSNNFKFYTSILRILKDKRIVVS